MNLKYNYHTHTYLCKHATGKVIDYVEEASRLGYLELGMSDHAHIPLKYFTEKEIKDMYLNDSMTLNEFDEVYLRDIEDAQKQYPNLRIYKGLESEYISEYHDLIEALRKKLDYMILGVHFFKYNGKIVDSYKELTDDEVMGYALTVKEALNTHMFKVLAHPDLFLLKNKFKDKYKEAIDIIVDSCIQNNVYLEINANGKDNTYPYYEFFNYIKDRKVKMIIGIDAHDPKRLSGNHITKVLKLIEELDLHIYNKIEEW